MNVKLTFIIVLLILIGCSHHTSSKQGVSIPDKPGKYPKVTKADRLRGELTHYRSCYDVTSYNLAVELDIDKKSVFGKCQINARALQKIDTLQVDLFKRKNKPNPIFYNELKNLLKHFIWNWEEYLEKNRLIF